MNFCEINVKQHKLTYSVTPNLVQSNAANSPRAPN